MRILHHLLPLDLSACCLHRPPHAPLSSLLAPSLIEKPLCFAIPTGSAALHSPPHCICTILCWVNVLEGASKRSEDLVGNRLGRQLPTPANPVRPAALAWLAQAPGGDGGSPLTCPTIHPYFGALICAFNHRLIPAKQSNGNSSPRDLGKCLLLATSSQPARSNNAARQQRNEDAHRRSIAAPTPRSAAAPRRPGAGGAACSCGGVRRVGGRAVPPPRRCRTGLDAPA
jgi:hypothetical protein